MSSSDFFDGRIEITPALNFAEIKKARGIAMTILSPTGWEKKHATTENVFESYMPLTFDLDSFEKETEEGPLQVTRALALKPTNDSNGAYAGRMKALVEALIKGLPGHNWVGTVESIDEDRNHALKIVVTTTKNTSTVKQLTGKGIVKWEDGSTTDVEEISG